MAFNLKQFLQAAGTVADAVIPGNQSNWHKPAAPAPARTARPQVSAPTAPQVSYPNFTSTAPIPRSQVQPIKTPSINMPLETAKQAVGGIVNDVKNGVTGIPVHLGLQLADMANAATGHYDPNTPATYQASNPVTKAIFGSAPIKSYQGQATDASKQLQHMGVNPTLAGAASIPISGLLAGLDLSQFHVAGGAKPALEAAAQSGVKATTKLVGAASDAYHANPALASEAGHVNFNTPIDRTNAIQEAQANVADLQNQINMRRSAIDEAKHNIGSNPAIGDVQKTAAVNKAVNEHTQAIHDAQVEMGGWMDHIGQLDPTGNSRPLLHTPDTGVPLEQRMSYDAQPSPASKIANILAGAKNALKSQRGSVDLGAEVGGNSRELPIVGKPLGAATKSAGLGPMPPSLKVSSKGLSPDEAVSRFPARIAADNRANDNLVASMQANGTHDVLHNKDVLANVDEAIAKNPDQALALAKRGRTTEANATALRLIDTYLNEGKFEQADELTRAVSPRFTRQGQETQILSIYSRLTPAGAVRYASHQLEKAAQSTSKANRVEPEAAKITKALHDTNAQAAEQVAKEFSAKAPSGDRPAIQLGAKEGTPATKVAPTPEERLAKRIKATSSKSAGPDPIKDMVNTLYKVAKQVLPEGPKKIPRDPMELIGLAVKEKGEYSRVYQEAKKLVEDKYKDNPAALAELESCFNTEANRTYARSQLNKGIQNGLKGVDLGKLVRGHYSTVNKAGDALKNKLMKQAGLSEDEAGQLAGDIQGRFSELTQAKKESVLNQMFKNKPTPAQKSAAQKVIEMSNLGAFDKEDIRNLAGQKLGLPGMTPELASEIKSMADKIQGLEVGPERNRAVAEMMQHIQKQVPQHLLGNIVSVWKAGLLSGVKTQGGNALSNSTFAGLKSASSPITSLADTLMSLKTGERTATTTGRGYTAGFKEGVAKGIDTMKTGIDERNISNDKYEQHAEINFNNKVVQKVFGGPANVVFRGMAAADQPFYYGALKNSMFDMAKADGLNKDLHGPALVAHMKQLVADPTEEMVQTAKDAADKAVLAHDTILGKVVPAIKRSIDQQEWVSTAGRESAKAAIDVLVPFTKVPSAFLSRVIDFTALGPVKTILSQVAHQKFDQRSLAEAIGEGVTGTGIVALGIALAQNSLLAGDYPKNDPKEAARWKAEHKTANSVKIGGNWISLNYLGPLGLLFNAGNKIQEAARAGGSIAAQAGAALAGIGQGLVGQSFLQGFSGFSDAISDPARNAKSFLNSQSASIVPNIVNDVGNATDSMQRQASSVLDAIKAKIPGLRQTLSPKIDTFGNDLSQPAGGLNAALNPGKPSSDNHTPLLTELDRLASTDKNNSVAPVPATTIGSVKLTPEQQTQRQKLVGEKLTPLWNSIIASPGYSKLDDAHKALALQSALTDVNSAANREMLSQIDSSKNDKPASKRVGAVIDGSVTATTYLTKAASGGSKSTVNPADKYKTDLAQYQQDKSSGKLTSLDDLKAQKTLSREAVTSKYSKDVVSFYNLSKADMNTLFKTDPTSAKNLYDQAKKLDAELGGNKFKNGLSTKRGSSVMKRATTKKLNYASRLQVTKSSSTMGALRHLVKAATIKRKAIKK